MLFKAILMQHTSDSILYIEVSYIWSSPQVCVLSSSKKPTNFLRFNLRKKSKVEMIHLHLILKFIKMSNKHEFFKYVFKNQQKCFFSNLIKAIKSIILYLYILFFKFLFFIFRIPCIMIDF